MQARTSNAATMFGVIRTCVTPKCVRCPGGGEGREGKGREGKGREGTLKRIKRRLSRREG
jgi:hypothetical protein